MVKSQISNIDYQCRALLYRPIHLPGLISDLLLIKLHLLNIICDSLNGLFCNLTNAIDFFHKFNGSQSNK